MKDFLMIRYICLAVIFIMIILAGLIGILSIKYHSDTDIAFLLLAGICILIGIILQIAIQDNRIDPESLQRADSELPDSLRFAGRKNRKAVIISGAAFWKSQLMKKHIR